MPPAKLMNAGFRSNNLDPNARHCMASAADAFMRTFGMDEPMGCYDDIEDADAFVLWGSNMAEMHPILWTRVTDRRWRTRTSRSPCCRLSSTSFDLADIPIVFTPRTDLAILNYIANHIIRPAGSTATSSTSTPLLRGTTDIGYGLRPEHPLEKAAKAPADAADGSRRLRRLCDVRAEYTLDKVAELSGVERPARGSGRTLRRPEAQGHVALDDGVQPARRVASGPTTWSTNPSADRKNRRAGQQPVLADRQPSACGTAREVGTFAHRLPADMTVTNPEHRKHAEEIWQVPAGLLPGEAGIPCGRAGPHAEGRQAQFLLDSGQQQPPGGAQHPERNLSRLSQSRELHRRFRRLPDDHGEVGRPCPAGGDVGREGGRLRQRRAPHPRLAPAGHAPGEASSDLWQLVESSKHFTTDEVWPAEILDENPEYRGKTLYEVLFRNGVADRFPLAKRTRNTRNIKSKHFGFYIQKGLFEEYAAFGRRHGHDLADFDRYRSGARHALAGGRQ